MNEPVRILNIVGEMSPGGIETLIMNIYRHIDRTKIQFDFLQHSPSGNGSFNEEIEKMGGRVYQIPYIKTQKKTYYLKIYKYKKALKKFFSSHKEYYIIHGHMTNTASIYIPIAKKYGNVKCCIAHSHLTQARPGLSGFVTNLLHKKVPKLATDYFACSEQAAYWIFPSNQIEKGKVKIIKNGVDTNIFNFNPSAYKKTKKSLGLEGKIVIGNVARFKKEKNHTFQIDIINELVKRDNRYVLLLIGDGELKNEICEKVNRLGLQNNVVFLGIRKDVPILMEAMDIFLLPSLYEGLPVVGIEAQAMGLPVITSTGVTKETDITGNVTFLDLSAGDKKWADEIQKICSSFERKNMREFIIKNGYDIRETSNWLEKFYLDKYEEIKRK